MEANRIAPIPIERFVAELEKVKRDVDAGALKPQYYDSRLARIIGELRERGLDSDRAVATAALADALARGIITSPVHTHIQNRLGLA